jgi:hypothetical protein
MLSFAPSLVASGPAGIWTALQGPGDSGTSAAYGA